MINWNWPAAIREPLLILDTITHCNDFIIAGQKHQYCTWQHSTSSSITWTPPTSWTLYHNKCPKATASILYIVQITVEIYLKLLSLSVSSSPSPKWSILCRVGLYYTIPSLFILAVSFPGGLWLAGTRMFPFWILLELRMMEVMMTTTAVTRAKSQSRSSPPTNQHPTFYRSDAFPVARATVSKHWRENISNY